MTIEYLGKAYSKSKEIFDLKKDISKELIYLCENEF